MPMGEVTWAIVALAAVQTIHALVTGWFAWAESRCQQQLRRLKHEIANMRHQMTLDLAANRCMMASVKDKMDTGGRDNLPPAV